MRRFFTILRLMNTMSLRSRTVFFFSLIMPTGSLLLFGFIFGQNIISIAGGSNFSYAIWLLPGVVITNMMASGMMGNSAVMITWREKGIFKRIAVTPTPIWQIMLTRVITQIVVILIQVILAIVVGVFVFKYKFNLAYMPLVFLFVIIGALVFLSIGQVIASFTDRVELGSIISQGIYIVFSFLTGVMLPLQILPAAVTNFATYTPSYMTVSLLRSAMLQGTAGSGALFNVVGLTLYFVAAIGVSATFFKMIR
jgi:ABC-2 type transport system permease protein